MILNKLMIRGFNGRSWSSGIDGNLTAIRVICNKDPGQKTRLVYAFFVKLKSGLVILN